MQEIMTLSFMQNAFLGAFFVSIACGIVGTLIVINRMSFIAGGVAHGAYGGIGVALFFGFAPLVGVTLFSIFLALLIGYITLKDKEGFDAIIGAIWAFGMAVGIVLIDLTPGYRGDLMSYLFGSILTISSQTLWFIAVSDLLFIGIVALFYYKICAVSFDMEFAKIKGVNTTFFYYLIIMMMAFCVVATIQVVGLLLVIALITIPPFIAQRFTNSLFSMMICSVILSIFFCFSGLILSYYLNLTSGASIILVASFVFFATMLPFKFQKR